MEMPRDSISLYFDLYARRPEMFSQSGPKEYPLVLDEARMRRFSQKTGRSMGVVYENGKHYMMVADLCLNEKGEEISYARVIYPNPTNGGVALPYKDGQFGLLRNYRHPPRREMLELPRGFAEKDLTPEENIRKELREEMLAEVSCVTCIGKVRADTGLAAGYAEVFLAEVVHAEAAVGHEGIKELIWLSEEELDEKIASGQITDGFTLSALTLYHAWKKKQ